MSYAYIHRGGVRRSMLLAISWCLLGLSPPQKAVYMAQSLGYGMKLMLTRKHIAAVLADPQLAQLYGDQLAEVARIKAIAERYGLNADTYNHMVFPPDDPVVVSYLVTASERLALEAVKEWFPLVGKVHYLGYFKEEDRDRKAAELAQRYDVATVRAGAFSLLGYMADPIFPSMLQGARWAMAEMFIHEMVHGTIWIKNAHEFNEHLADFIAATITEQYLSEEDDQAELAKKSVYQADKDRFAQWFAALERALTGLYASAASDEVKLAEKAKIFKHFAAQKPAFERYDFVGQPHEWNNAKVVLTQVYAPDLRPFIELEQCWPPDHSSSLPVLIATLKRRQHELVASTVLAMLEQICAWLAAA